MSKPIDLGPNRTGIGTSPVDAKKATENAEAGVPSSSFDTSAHHKVSVSYSREAQPLGTLPPPASAKGMVKSAAELVKGHKPTVFLDLIGDRIAFERTGTRLYESLLCRYDAADIHEGDPTREALERIRDDELQHFHMLVGAMKKLGGDPTAVTPTADVSAVASSGLLQVVSDPRTTLTEALHAIHLAELADNDAWLMLSDLAERLGHDQMAADFKRALVQEEEHLALVRGWIENAIQGQSGVEKKPRVSGPEPAQPAP